MFLCLALPFSKVIAASKTNIGCLYCFEQLNQSSPLLMMSFMILGYFFFAGIHRYQFWERLSAMSKGILVHYHQAFKFTLILSTSSFFLFFAVSLIIAGRDLLNQRLFVQIIFNSFQYFFLLPAIGFLSGVLVSFVKNEILCSLILLIILIILTPFPEMLIGLTLSPFILKAIHYFKLWPRTPYILPRYSYGLEGNKEKLFISLFCLSIVGALILYLAIRNKKERKAKHYLSVFFLLAAAAFFFWQSSYNFSFLPISRYILDEGPTIDQNYYNRNQRSKGQSGKDDSFKVVAYSGTISISDRLIADMNLEYKDLHTQPLELTLYHHFRVKEIHLGEYSVHFEQEMDTIRILDALPFSGILTIRYEGHGNRYISNHNAIFLPSGFPYYPMPGDHSLYIDSLYGFYPVIPSYQCRFDVSVQYKWPIYSNLSVSAGGQLHGEAQAMSIFSGMYNSIQIQDVQVIYPSLNPAMSEESIRKNFEFAAAENAFMMNKNLVVLDRVFNAVSPYEKFILTDDFLLLENINSTEIYKDIWKFNPEKYPTYLLLKHAERNDDEYHQRALVGKRSDNEFYRFYEIIENDPARRNRILEMIRAYIFNNGDIRTASEVISDLEGYIE